MAVELTEDIREALAANPDDPLQLVDPLTRQDYVLVRRATYERLRAASEEAADAAFEEARLEEATGIRREWAREGL